MATTDEVRKQALERVKAKRALRSSAVTFALISLILVGIWAIAGGGWFWPVFPMGAFCLALALQAWHIYGEKPISEEEIRREMERRGGAG